MPKSRSYSLARIFQLPNALLRGNFLPCSKLPPEKISPSSGCPCGTSTQPKPKLRLAPHSLTSSPAPANRRHQRRRRAIHQPGRGPAPAPALVPLLPLLLPLRLPKLFPPCRQSSSAPGNFAQLHAANESSPAIRAAIRQRAGPEPCWWCPPPGAPAAWGTRRLGWSGC